MTSPSTASSHHLHLRGPGEHVILADCKDQDGIFSSQMAYWPTSPITRTPSDVSVVYTGLGQTAVWAGMKTESIFTASGVKFIAKLGPKVAEGKYAGSGSNGYDGEFSCWQVYRRDSYVYGNTSCSQVYDCDRRPIPATLSSPIPTAAPETTQNTTTSIPNTIEPSSQGELSFGALIAIIVGAVAAFLIAAIAGFLIWRAFKREGTKPNLFLDLISSCCCGPGRKKPVELSASPEPSELEVKRDSGLYEMDGTWTAELSGGPILAMELGGKEQARVAWELDSPTIKMSSSSILGRARKWSWFPGDDRPLAPSDVEKGRRGKSNLGGEGRG